MRDLITDLRSIEDDERVDFHARGTAERAAEEIERLRKLLDDAAANLGASTYDLDNRLADRIRAALTPPDSKGAA